MAQHHLTTSPGLVFRSPSATRMPRLAAVLIVPSAVVDIERVTDGLVSSSSCVHDRPDDGMALNAHAKHNDNVRAIIETDDDDEWKNGKTSIIKERNDDCFTPNNSINKIENMVSEHVKNYEPLRRPIMTRQDFPFSSVSESSKSINGHLNYVGSQNNKLEQTCLNKEFESLVLFILFGQFHNSPELCQMKLFKLRERIWKEKFKKLQEEFNQMLKTFQNLPKGQPARQFSSEDNNSKLLPKGVIQIDLDKKLLNCHKRTINQSKTSNTTNSRIINLDTSSQDTDAMKNIVSNMFKTCFSSTLKTPSLQVTVLLSRSTNPPKVVLKWDLETNVRSYQINGNIIEYEIALIAYFNGEMINVTIGALKAFQLPMSCTIQLPIFLRSGAICYFAIRSKDKEERCGPYNIALPVKL